MTNFKFLWQYVQNQKSKFIIGIILLVLSSITNIFIGVLNGSVVESIVNLEIKKAFIFLAIYFLCNFLFMAFFQKISYKIFEKIEIKVKSKINFDVYKKVLELPATAFEELNSGELINRTINDSETVSNTVGNLIGISLNFLTNFLVLIYIFYNSYIVGLEIILFLIIFSFIVKYFNPRIKEENIKIKKINDKYTSLTNESINGIREINTLGIKKHLYNNISTLIDAIYDRRNNLADIKALYSIVTTLLRITLECGVFATCIFLVYKQTISLTFFVAMTYYIYQYMWLIDNFTEISKNYQELSVAIKRISEILNNKLYDDVKYGNINLTKSIGKIEFRNVKFNYKNEKTILNNFNLIIKPNQKIAIVGSSGQGKSTIFNLLTRIFDAVSGEILIDDINIKALNESSLRKTISIVRQEPFIFNDTIKNNFMMIDQKITTNEIRKYTKMAFIDAYIMNLDKKYNTLLGEHGVNLSGGEKQRIAIARALIKESKIILFDEATSSLDNESQMYIKKSIDELSKDHTIIIIAHRLSTIIDADIIYVIDKGKVITSGSHEELIKNCPYYKNLYTKEGTLK